MLHKEAQHDSLPKFAEITMELALPLLQSNLDIKVAILSLEYDGE